MATEDESGSDPKESVEEAVEAQAPEGQEAEAMSSDDAAPAKRSGKSRKKARERERIAAEAARRPSIAPASAVAFAIVALAAGAAAGWFGHIAQAKAKLQAAAPAASGSAAASGPCASWEKQICAGSGTTSAACEQAKSATGLLTPATCEVALEAVPATLVKVKAERAPCNSLVAKLCKDLPPGSPACTMVTERTPMFPPEKCKELLANYDSVLQEVKMIDQQGGMPQQGMPPGAHPGMPPGAHPPH